MKRINFVLIILFTLFATANSFAQGHTLQVDNGAGAYSTIVGGTPGATFTLPPGPAPQTILTMAAGGVSPVWLTTGNSLSGVDGTNNILGSLAGSALTPVNIVVNGVRAMRFVYTGFGANIIGGDASNSIAAGGTNNTISGGGAAGFSNTISSTGSYNAIGGGGANVISGTFFTGTIGGGGYNQVSAFRATVAGGAGNTASGQGAFVGGGENGVALGANNTASGTESMVGGGITNTASAPYSNWLYTMDSNENINAYGAAPPPTDASGWSLGTNVGWTRANTRSSPTGSTMPSNLIR